MNFGRNVNIQSIAEVNLVNCLMASKRPNWDLNSGMSEFKALNKLY